MDLREQKRLDKVNRMEKYLKELMTDGYIINSGRYFLTGGLKQYNILSEDDKIEIFAEGSKWIINHETKSISIRSV